MVGVSCLDKKPNRYRIICCQPFPSFHRRFYNEDRVGNNQQYHQYETNLVVTSCNDGHHSLTSLHYSGNAVDLRTRNLPDNITGHIVRDEIKKNLNIDYDVVLESDHIHLEYQPRRR